MNDYPAMIAPVNHVEPVPRRIRAFLDGEQMLDTTRALYVWEWPYYPQYYIPLADVRRDLLIPEGHTQQTGRGVTEPQGVRAGGIHRPHAARLVTSSPIDGLAGTVRFDWAALDAWFEEDEQVFVHPRNPYVRVDALRSNRPVRVELEGVVLADSRSPVMVFETGLPTRYYLSRTDVDFGNLIPTDTVTACPYKGMTSGYWSVRAGGTVHRDLAWSYDFPARQLLPIAGMVAFYNEKVDILLDGQRLERPRTHFFPSDDSRTAHGPQEPPKAYEPTEARIRLGQVDPCLRGQNGGAAMSTELELASWRRMTCELYAAVRSEEDPQRGHALWRRGREELFRSHPQSPLPPGDPLRTTGLPYWPYDPRLRFEVPLLAAEGDVSRSVPSTDGTITMDRIGCVHLPAPVDAVVDAWWLRQYGGGLFLPLRDGTSGRSSYGGGRYALDTAKGADLGSRDGHLVIDLNFLYHPSCRYSDSWQCPLAPPGNTISSPISAGELLPS